MIKLRKEYKSMRMLIVEDEKDLCNILKKRLQKDYTIDICMDGEIAKDYLNTYTYDIILLDIMLPKIDGITLLKWLRNQKKTTPVLLLTAKSSIEERVNGLDSGADDYLIKPFAFEELQARLRVLLRRNIAADPSDILIYKDLLQILFKHALMFSYFSEQIDNCQKNLSYNSKNHKHQQKSCNSKYDIRKIHRSAIGNLLTDFNSKSNNYDYCKYIDKCNHQNMILTQQLKQWINHHQNKHSQNSYYEKVELLVCKVFLVSII